MIINGSNSIQGLFNHATAPVNTTWTVSDIVLKDGILYVCKQETQSTPDISLDDWEYYLGGVESIKSFSEFSDSSKDNYLVTLSAFNEFLQNYWSGLNVNGTLKLLNDPTITSLDTLMSNSSYQLSVDYLNSISTTLPFSVNSSKVYVVRTTGDLNNGSVLSPTIFAQELIEFDKSSPRSSRRDL